MYVDTNTCAICGGKCCKRLPGANLPEDFNLPADTESLKLSLFSGKYTIDWYECHENGYGYFIRPATKGMEGILEDPSWGGECTFLTPSGCSLDSESRPWACRVLEPKTNGNCIFHGIGNGKKQAADCWTPYVDLLREIIGFKEE